MHDVPFLYLSNIDAFIYNHGCLICRLSAFGSHLKFIASQLGLPAGTQVFNVDIRIHFGLLVQIKKSLHVCFSKVFGYTEKDIHKKITSLTCYHLWIVELL